MLVLQILRHRRIRIISTHNTTWPSVTRSEPRYQPPTGAYLEIFPSPFSISTTPIQKVAFHILITKNLSSAVSKYYYTTYTIFSSHHHCNRISFPHYWRVYELNTWVWYLNFILQRQATTSGCHLDTVLMPKYEGLRSSLTEHWVGLHASLQWTIAEHVHRTKGTLNYTCDVSRSTWATGYVQHL